MPTSFKDESLYSPYDFEAGLVKEIGKLSGLENHLKEELDLLILYIIREVDNAFDEGYLYDHYKDVHFEEPEAFTTLVENYIKNLPYSEKIDFLGRLDVVLTESSYSTFKNLSTLTQGIFNDEDLPALKTLLVNNLKQLSTAMIIKYYGFVRHLMISGEKKIVLLNKDKCSSWLIELAE